MKRIIAMSLIAVMTWLNGLYAMALTPYECGIIVPITIDSTISSAALYEGSIIPISCSDNVLNEGKIVFAKGSKGTLKINRIEHASTHGGPGVIEVTQGLLKGTDGVEHPIQIQILQRGKSKRASSIVLSVVGVLVILCPFGLFRYGDEATLYQGQSFNAITIE